MSLTRAPEMPTFEARFARDGALRRRIGRGRAHVDRWLPFLVLHRGEPAPESLAARVAVNSPAYLVWPAEDDETAAPALAAIAGRLAERAGRLLVVTLDDRPFAPGAEDQPHLPPFTVRVGGSPGKAATRAAKAFGAALVKLEVDLRRCDIETTVLEPSLPPAIEAVLGGIAGVERLSVALPQIYRRPDGGIFPGVTHDLAVAAGDAVLRAVCAFVDDGAGRAPGHYRAFGRSAYLAAARKADRKIDALCGSFDFLLSISPINTAEARAKFLADGGERAPDFHYRPLSVDPDIAKRDLYAIDLAALEDPLLAQLLGEKRREVDAQLTMLATRNTSAFRPASMFLYGGVEPGLLADARAILASSAADPPRGPAAGTSAIRDAACAVIAGYRKIDRSFAATVEVRADVAGLLVSAGRLLIAADAQMPAARLPALLAHEVGVHLLTYFNGLAQGLGIFRTGFAGYEGVQEGLGVFAEWASGGLTQTRLRLLAGRVVAVDAMLGGAGFVEVWRLLSRDHGFSRGGAFGIVARVFRSGGLAKDAIYLRGFRAVMDMAAAGISLEPFWMGKIAPGHVPAIEELLHRGLVRPPKFRPAFLEDEAARARIARLRGGGSLEDMLTEGNA